MKVHPSADDFTCVANDSRASLMSTKCLSDERSATQMTKFSNGIIIAIGSRNRIRNFLLFHELPREKNEKNNGFHVKKPEAKRRIRMLVVRPWRPK